MESRAGKGIISFWLMPAEREREQFASIIRDLADRLEAPFFDPHVTVVNAAISEAEGARIVEQVAPRHAPFKLVADGVKFSENVIKTLFVQFRSTSELTALHDDVRNELSRPVDYELNPHLSILYQKLPEAKKAELARSVSLPAHEIVFSALRVMLIPTPVESTEDVKLWRLVTEHSLTGVGGPVKL